MFSPDSSEQKRAALPALRSTALKRHTGVMIYLLSGCQLVSLLLTGKGSTRRTVARGGFLLSRRFIAAPSF